MKNSAVILITACALILVNSQALARGRLLACDFSWAENPSLNIKGGHVEIQKKIRMSMFNRIMELGTVEAVMNVILHGAKCQFSHPESKYISRNFDPIYHGFRIKYKGRIPTCNEIQMTVTCRDPLLE